MEAKKSTNYKALKEAFVSGHSGGSALEINIVTLVAPSAILLWSVLQSRFRLFKPYTPQAALTETLLNCGAILSAITVYSSHSTLLNLLLTAPAVLILATRPPVSRRQGRPRQPAQSTTDDGKDHSDDKPAGSSQFPVKPFVTMYRGGMMIGTCAAILAVDFRVFPRRFAKVENWGTSMMDLGVGSFVFSAGVVSARSVLKDISNTKKTSLLAKLAQSVRHAVPLLVLGLVRLWSVKGVDYAEHVTEYGVHWNFFFTLGFLPPFVVIFNGLFSLIPSYAVLALLVGTAYEIALGSTRLTAFILSGPRENLFSQNREGIFSFFGYLAMFLAGQGTGMYVLPREKSPPTKSTTNPKFQTRVYSLVGPTLVKLVLWTAIWTALYEFSTSYYGLNLSVSRRLANLPYIIWVCAFNTGQLAVLLGIERVCFGDLYAAKDAAVEKVRCRDATSSVMQAFNRNGLAIFLVANLLTGAVNLTMPTLNMKRLESMSVLGLYMSVLTAAALGLDMMDVSIKL